VGSPALAGTQASGSRQHRSVRRAESPVRSVHGGGGGNGGSDSEKAVGMGGADTHTIVSLQSLVHGKVALGGHTRRSGVLVHLRLQLEHLVVGWWWTRKQPQGRGGGVVTATP
jgi:hypothetical protein